MYITELELSTSCCVLCEKCKVIMRRYLYYILITSILSTFTISCNSSREVAERRNYMIPKRSEKPRNAQKYKEVERKYPKKKKVKSVR